MRRRRRARKRTAKKAIQLKRIRPLAFMSNSNFS
nr:MAG TPA: hypothetical protein [Caudoviricetes sp.]